LFTVNEEQPSYYVVKVPSDNKTAIQRLNSLVMNMTTMVTTNTQLNGAATTPTGVGAMPQTMARAMITAIPCWF